MKKIILNKSNKLDSLKYGLSFLFFIGLAHIGLSQNNIGNIDDRCKTTNYRAIDGWGEYPVEAGQSTDPHDPRIERKDLAKINLGDKWTFEATYKIVAADNSTIAQILNQDQSSPDKHKPVVFIIADKDGSNWKLRDQQFNLGPIQKDAEFVLRIDTYYNSSKTTAYSDIYINGAKKETKTHARVGQDAQMRYGCYHHGAGTAVIRVKNVTWQSTAQYLAGGGGGGGTNNSPTVNITSPANNATFTLGQTINLAATATDSDGTIDRVNFKVNDAFHSNDTDSPYIGTFKPTAVGTYVIAARSFDDKGAAVEKSVTINVTAANNAPSGYFVKPSFDEIEVGYAALHVLVKDTDVDGDSVDITLFIDDKEIRQEKSGPFEWGHVSAAGDFTAETKGLTIGTHVLKAVITDELGLSKTISKTIRVIDKVTGISLYEESGLSVYPNPSEDGIFHLNQSTDYKVYNTQGIEIKSGNDSNIDLSNELKGVYILKIGTNQLKVLK